MRVCGVLETQVKRSKPNADGEQFSYAKAGALVTPVGAPQLDALGAWTQDENCQAELLEAIAAFKD